MDPLTRSLRALSDPTRRKVLDLLRSGQQSVTDLAREFSMSRPAVSKHLAILREAGLVVSHRAGRRQIYELDRAPFVAVEAWLARYRQQAGPTQRPVRWLRSRRVEPRDDWQCW